MVFRDVCGLVALSILLVSCATGSGSLPATGQEDWYQNNGSIANCEDFANFTGPTDVPPIQDGRIMAGCSMENRFDLIAGVVVHDTCTDLMWQKVPASAVRSWGGALALSKDLTLAGFDDWRAPNVHELLSIVHYGRSNPALDDAFIFSPRDDVSPQPNSIYWSSTSSNALPQNAWVVNFGHGEHSFTEKTDLHAVRAVRGGQIPFRLTVLACQGGVSP